MFTTIIKEGDMDINTLTVGQVRELAALLNAAPAAAQPHPFVGKYAICRCYSAGVHAGTVVSVDGDKVILTDSRRLWKWQAKDGIALSGVAQHGIVAKDSKIDTVNPQIYLTGAIEIIPTTDAARESIHNA